MNKPISICLLLLIFVSCSSLRTANRVKIMGSDTMLYLMELLAKEYMMSHPDDVIYIEGGGSATGVNALINGEVDICTASRKLNPDEIMRLTNKYGSVGISYLIAKDALCVYVHPENPVHDFSKNTLKDIFTCKITNWKDLGGRNAPITVYIRNINSGTYHYFKQHVLDGDEYCTNLTVKSTTKGMVEDILQNPDAIGYGGIGYGKDAKYASINGAAPTEANVRSDVYPITRYLHFYTLNEATGAVKRFIGWVLSSEGQNVISKSGYIPLWEKK